MVERGTVVKKVDIPRSPVQFRNGGFVFYNPIKNLSFPASGRRPDGGAATEKTHKHRALVHDLNLFIYREICTTVQFDQNQNGDRTQRVFRFFVFL